MNIYRKHIAVRPCCSSVATQSDDETWIEYKIKFGKSHNRDDEFFRKQLFLKTHRLIKDHSSSGKSWRPAHNHFFDYWTDEGRQRMFNKKLADVDVEETLAKFQQQLIEDFNLH